MEKAPDSSSGMLLRAQARIGLVLRQKWRLDALLGVGGMAAVYAGTHRNGARGAIKILHAEYSAMSEVKRRFLREGYVANAVVHPGVVRVLDDDISEDGAAFLVMDLLLGETLDSRLERRGGRLPPEEALPILDELLDILSCAHTARVVHRDLKPENVFITSEGVVKLLDFGIARLQTVQPGSLATVSGSTFGTPAFMPPEQALGHVEDIDAQSDLWGAGAVLFTMLTGRLVHQTRTLNEQLVAHASRAAPSLAEVAPELDARLSPIVDRALAFHKSDRWLDARQMQGAIREVEAKLGWPRTVSLAFRADPAILASGMQRAVAAIEVATPFPSMPATSSPVGGTGGAPPKRTWQVVFFAGLLVAVLGAGAVLLFFAPGPFASRLATPRPAAPGLTAAIVVPAPPVVVATAAPTVTPQPSAEPSASATASAEPTSEAAASASAARTSAPPRKFTGHFPRPLPSPSVTAKAVVPPKQAGDADWLDRQH